MPEPPSGMLTFLFTEIEGSTRFWETQPDAMAEAQARHDSILQNTIERHGGWVYHVAGDSFGAAFLSPRDALAAAIAAQSGLLAEVWPLDEPLRVRMAIQSGEGTWRGLDYLAPCLNRLSRLLRAAHGGQTLVSAATHELLIDQLPSGVSLCDLGEHRLRDLSHAEHIYQVMAPGLPAEFPRIKSLDWMRGDFGLAEQTLEKAIAIGRSSGPEARAALASALRSLGATKLRLGDREAAYANITESAAICRELGDLPGLGAALFSLCRIAIESGDFEAAWALARDSRDACVAAGDDDGLGLALTNLGLIALERRDFAAARSAYEENLRVMQRTDDHWGTAVALIGLAELAQLEGDLDSAQARFESSMSISKRLGNKGDVARCLRGLGIVACNRGDPKRAARLLVESLGIYQAAGFERGQAECLESFAALALVHRECGEAVRFLAAGSTYLTGNSLLRWPANAFDFELAMREGRSCLTEAKFDEAWSEGSELGLGRSVERALHLGQIWSGDQKWNE